MVQLQQNICHQNDCEHEWQSIFSPKRTRRSEQNFLRRDEYRRPGSRYFAWQHLVYQAGNLEFNSSSDRQPMKLTQYRCDVLSDVSLLDNHSTYGMTANPLLSCANLFLFFCVYCLFPFLTLVMLYVENPLFIAAAGQGVNLNPERTQLHEQRWRGVQLTDNIWPSSGHVLNITWPQAWWSSPLASKTLQLI